MTQYPKGSAVYVRDDAGGWAEGIVHEWLMSGALRVEVFPRWPGNGRRRMLPKGAETIFPYDSKYGLIVQAAEVATRVRPRQAKD